MVLAFSGLIVSLDINWFSWATTLVESDGADSNPHAQTVKMFKDFVNFDLVVVFYSFNRHRNVHREMFSVLTLRSPSIRTAVLGGTEIQSSLLYVFGSRATMARVFHDLLPPAWPVSSVLSHQDDRNIFD
jgi:hypothetical protein